jgi:DNA-binding beta-propeller fold protein YncE
MANVFFKRGLQNALPATGTNGAFYLTTDTNRLYVCNSDNGPLVELNQSINTVTKMSDLPAGTSAAAKGQYYYITELNALAYHNGTEWVQINPDTKLVDKE